MKSYKISKRILALLTALLLIFCTVPVSAQAAEGSTYGFSDINLQVTIPEELICFTRSVTSNNSYLDLIGAEDVEELRSLMKINNIYLEAIPKDVAYEIIISGKVSGKQADYNTLSEGELNSLFEEYISASDNIENSSVTENVTNSFIENINGQPYFVTDIKSVANNYVTVYARRYYTVILGNAITFSIQANSQELNDDMKNTISTVINSAEYKPIKKSIFENAFVSEILSSLITLIVPIAVLGIAVLVATKSTKKTKRQIEADEERLRFEYAKQEQEKQAAKDNGEQ